MDPNQQIPQGGGNPQGPNGQQGNPQGPNGQQIRPPWPWPAYFPCCPWPWPPYFPPYLHYPFDAHVGLGIPGQGGAAGVGIQGQGGAMAGAAGVQNDGAGPRPINAQNGGIPAQAVWVPDVGGNAPAGEQQGVAGRKRPRFNDEEASNISYTFKFYGTNHAPLTVVKDENLQVHVPGAVPQQLAPANAVHVPGADPQQVAPANAHVPVVDQASNHL